MLTGASGTAPASTGTASASTGAASAATGLSPELGDSPNYGLRDSFSFYRSYLSYGLRGDFCFYGDGFGPELWDGFRDELGACFSLYRDCFSCNRGSLSQGSRGCFSFS